MTTDRRHDRHDCHDRRQFIRLASAGLAASWVGCGKVVYTERHYATAITYVDGLIERADEPLRAELAARKAEFDRRMMTLPSDPSQRSGAIRTVVDDVSRVRGEFQHRILEDLGAKALTLLQGGGYIGYWYAPRRSLLFRPDGSLSYAIQYGSSRRTAASGNVLRVDMGGLRLRVSNYPRADEYIVLDFVPRGVGADRRIGVGGDSLRPGT